MGLPRGRWRTQQARQRLRGTGEALRSTGVRFAIGRLTRHPLDPRGGQRRAAYRALWSEAASELGADVNDGPGGVLEIRRGDVVAVVDQHRVGLDPPEVGDGGKAAAQMRLADAGLSVPDVVEVTATDSGPALDFLADSGGAVVVKPSSAGGGKGITTGVRERGQLELAVARAGRFSSRVLVETQAEGDPYRFLLLEGRLLDVVRRRPPRLTGDGRSTVRQLIVAENRRRQSVGAWVILRADLDSVLTLDRQGMTLDSVAPAGVEFQVRTVNNQTGPRDCETVHEPISDELEAEVRAAAACARLRLAGVDVITPDVGRSLADGGGVILEVNRDPSPHMHYYVADRARATRVCVPILERLLSG